MPRNRSKLVAGLLALTLLGAACAAPAREIEGSVTEVAPSGWDFFALEEGDRAGIEIGAQALLSVTDGPDDFYFGPHAGVGEASAHLVDGSTDGSETPKIVETIVDGVPLSAVGEISFAVGIVSPADSGALPSVHFDVEVDSADAVAVLFSEAVVTDQAGQWQEVSIGADDDVWYWFGEEPATAFSLADLAADDATLIGDDESGRGIALTVGEGGTDGEGFDGWFDLVTLGGFDFNFEAPSTTTEVDSLTSGDWSVENGAGTISLAAKSDSNGAAHLESGSDDDDFFELLTTDSLDGTPLGDIGSLRVRVFGDNEGEPPIASDDPCAMPTAMINLDTDGLEGADDAIFSTLCQTFVESDGEVWAEYDLSGAAWLATFGDLEPLTLLDVVQEHPDAVVASGGMFGGDGLSFFIADDDSSETWIDWVSWGSMNGSSITKHDFEGRSGAVITTTTTAPATSTVVTVPGGGGRVTATLSTPSGNVVITLEGVEGEGTITVRELDSPPDEVPGTFTVLGKTYEVDLANATFEEAEICFPYSDAELVEAGLTVDDLRLIHVTDDGTLEDITTSVGDGMICGRTTSFSPFVIGSTGVSRVGGVDRTATAALASAAAFPDGADTVFVASSAGFADALAAGPAAALSGGPLLFVSERSLPEATLDELLRLSPERIFVAGGTGVVSDAVVRDLESATGASVTRVAGTTRYGTAAAIAERFAGTADVVYIALGERFPDALAAGAAAARDGAPVLLVTHDGVPAEVAARLEQMDLQRILVVGGTAAIQSSVLDDLQAYTLGNVLRVAGVDRFETAAEVASTFDSGVAQAVVTTGLGFADALAGVPIAASGSGPVLLVPTDTVPSAVAAELARLVPGRVIVLGGTAAIDDAVLNDLSDARLNP